MLEQLDSNDQIITGKYCSQTTYLQRSRSRATLDVGARAPRVGTTAYGPTAQWVGV